MSPLPSQAHTAASEPVRRAPVHDPRQPPPEDQASDTTYDREMILAAPFKSVRGTA